MRHTIATPAQRSSTTGPVVADAMIRFPKVCGSSTTVGQAREYLLDEHVHALLIVDDDVLIAVVEREDLPGAAATDMVWSVGRLADRVVDAGDDLASVTEEMAEWGLRRLAVVDDAGRLLGLLCRKRSRRGFYSDAGVAARPAAAADVRWSGEPDGTHQAMQIVVADPDASTGSHLHDRRL